ncbi:MAG: DUF4265 domain-containing protein [Byssovorax sp.]
MESIWAIEREDGYEIDNIPFCVKSLSVGDLIAARRDENGLLWFTKMLKPSGHITIQILFSREEDVASFRAQLGQMGCESEGGDMPELVAVDIPPTVKYEDVKNLLDEAEHEGRLEYQEACLGFL